MYNFPKYKSSKNAAYTVQCKCFDRRTLTYLFMKCNRYVVYNIHIYAHTRNNPSPQCMCKVCHFATDRNDLIHDKAVLLYNALVSKWHQSQSDGLWRELSEQVTKAAAPEQTGEHIGGWVQDCSISSAFRKYSDVRKIECNFRLTSKTWRFLSLLIMSA